MRWLIACAALGAVLTSPALAASMDRIRLRGEDCRDASEDVIASLEAKWRHWHRWPHIVQLCPLHAPDGRVVLSVLTLRFDLFDAAGVPESELDPTVPVDPAPSPRIFDPQGLVLGELPEAFPTGVPGEFRVVFTDWHDGFPYRIEMREIGAAAMGTYDLPPMLWNVARHRYEGKCPG